MGHKKVLKELSWEEITDNWEPIKTEVGKFEPKPDEYCPVKQCRPTVKTLNKFRTIKASTFTI